MSETPSQCSQLLELAGPDLYRRNLFRVLEISVDTSAREFQRQQNKRKIEKKLGIASSSSNGGPLALDQIPSDDDIRVASETLNSPVGRLLHEVFWFWPISGRGNGDAAITALDRGDAESAVDIWTKSVQDKEIGHVAKHNLTVLYHLKALDALARESDGKLGKKQRKQIANSWQQIFADWKEVLDDESFWIVVRERIRELDDVRLTTGFARRVRQTLPLALLLTNSRIARIAAENGNNDLAQLHVQILRNAVFDRDLAREAIHEALLPIRERLKTTVANAKSRLTAKPHRGCQYVMDLYEQSELPMTVIDSLLEETDVRRVGVHDMVAEAMLDGLIDYGNKTDDWQGSQKSLELSADVALGQALKTRIHRNTEIIKSNSVAGYAWCTQGYWDLPEHDVAKLEEAHTKCNAGDYEGAIAILVRMGVSLGSPLRRCVAFSLNRHAQEITDSAFEDYHKPPVNIEKVLSVLNREGSIRVPTPDTPSHAMPSCPCCGSTHYNRWTNYTWDGQELWMCSDCSARSNCAIEDSEHALRSKMETALQHALLAEEVDSSDPGLRRSLVSLRKVAAKFECEVPSTKPLKDRLGEEFTLAIGDAEVDTPTEPSCFFCGAGAPDSSCQISVPMHGDVKKVETLFGVGIEVHNGRAIVPRCRRCRDEHRELPGRIEVWQDARAEASSAEHFEDLLGAVTESKAVVDETKTHVETERQNAVEAESELAQAKRIGVDCSKCGQPLFNHLCNHCDSTYSAFGPTMINLFVGIVALALLTGGIFSIVAHSPAKAGIIFVVMIVSFLAVTIPWQRRRRSKASQGRGEENNRRRTAAVSVARQQLEVVQVALESARAKATTPEQALEQASRMLEAAEKAAAEEFEKVYPRPALPSDIKPEVAFKTAASLQLFLDRGWKYGLEPKAYASDDSGGPATNLVAGLVSRPSRPPVLQVTMQCPDCRKEHLVIKESETQSVYCSCGFRMLYRNGILENPTPTLLKTAREIAADRGRVAEMARGARPNDMVVCPVCSAEVKAKNLENHHDKLHRGAKVSTTPQTSTAPPTSAKRAKTHQYNESGACIHCGCSREAIEHFGWNCKRT